MSGPSRAITRIVVCFAVPTEARPFQRAADGHPEVSVLITGIGPDNARNSLTQLLAKQKTHCIISSGFAGGLDPAFTTGQVVFETALDSPWARRLAAAGALPTRFAHTPKVLPSAQQKQEARRATGAGAIDMESAALGELARGRGLEFAIVRVISDAADEDLPLDFNRCMSAQGQIQLSRLAGALLRRPARLVLLMRFHRALRAAAGKLSRVLAAAVANPSPNPSSAAMPNR